MTKEKMSYDKAVKVLTKEMNYCLKRVNYLSGETEEIKQALTVLKQQKPGEDLIEKFDKIYRNKYYKIEISLIALENDETIHAGVVDGWGSKTLRETVKKAIEQAVKGGWDEEEI